MAALTELDRKRAVEVTRVRMRLSQSRRMTAAELEAKGWRAWYAEIFGQKFVDALAPHHIEAIKWHWESRQALKRGERPDYLSYFSIWSRRHMKSTIARRIAVCDAAISGEGYCLYVGGTEEKVQGHALSVETLISSRQVKAYYPKLSQVRKGEQGGSKGWRQHFIYTDQGYVFHFVSLDKGVAGANIDDLRPSMIIPDDIDDREDSPAISQRRFKLLTKAVLPTRQDNTLILFAQNLISNLSVMYRIYKGKERALTNRFPTRPVPAIRGMKTKPMAVNGIVRDVITEGEPTWHLYGIPQAQDEINTVGLASFETEYNHDVEQQKTGLILPEWDEKVHVITWSQFQRIYGVRAIPREWTKKLGHDWGAIHPCVVSGWATASQGSARPGLHFVYKGLTFAQNTICDDVALTVIEKFAGLNTMMVRKPDAQMMAKWTSGRLTDVMDVPRKIAEELLKPKVAEWLEHCNIDLWHMSHEQKTIRGLYSNIYGLPFEACNPGADGGVEQFRHFLKTDYDQPHPFKPGEKGLAGLYFIVDDDQYYEIDTEGELQSLARDDGGLKLWRDQFPEWTWRSLKLTETGLQDDKPIKVNDDTGNSIMMITAHMGFDPAPPSEDQRKEMKIDPALRLDPADPTIDEPRSEGWQMARKRAEARAEAEIQQEDRSEFESFWGNIS